MKSKLVAAKDAAQVHVVVLDSGEEAFATLGRFAGEVMTEVPVALRRRKRPDLGIALIDLAATGG